MHDGVQLGVEGTVGHVHADDPVSHAVVKEPSGQALDPSGAGAVGQADHEAAVAQDLEVTTLDRGHRGPVLLAPQQATPGEGWVVAVDGLIVDRLAAPGSQGHGVDVLAPVEPGRGVAGEQVVGQRGDDELALQGGQEGGVEQRARIRGAESLAQLGARDAGQQHLGQLSVRQGLEEVCEDLRGGYTHSLGTDCLRKDELAGLRVGQGLGQQLAEVVDEDALGPQDRSQGVVLSLGPVDIEGVVEEKGGGVDRRQARDLATWTVDDHLAQAPGLGVDPATAVAHGDEGTVLPRAAPTSQVGWDGAVTVVLVRAASRPVRVLVLPHAHRVSRPPPARGPLPAAAAPLT